MLLHAPQSSNLSTCGYDKFTTHSPGSYLQPDSGHISGNNQSCFKPPTEVGTADYWFSYVGVWTLINIAHKFTIVDTVVGVGGSCCGATLVS